MIGVVIVTWNNANDIVDCIKSIIDTNYINYKIIVVDNDSSDNTVDLVKQNFPDIDILPQSQNKYFTGGVNIGINFAIQKYNAQFIFILNPDTIVDSNIFDVMSNCINADDSIGIVGPKIKYLPKDLNTIYSAGVVYDGFKIATQIGNKELDNGQYDKSDFLDCVEGTCLLLRVTMLNEIGLLWERLKMYSEDVELCIRARKKGWEIFYTHETTVWHKHALSINNNSELNLNYQKEKNWLWIALRHYKIKSKLAMLKKYFLFLIKLSDIQ
jgi:GT2 family glycosyltransferase